MSQLSTVEDIYSYLLALGDPMAVKIGKLLDTFSETGDIDYLEVAISTFSNSELENKLLELK